MEYQPLPPVSTMQQLTNGGGGGNNQNHGVVPSMTQNTLQSLNSMQPPLLPLSMPLQVVHNLQQLNNNNINTTNNNTILNNNNNNNSQNLPPPSQLLQAIHQTNGGNGPPNNTNPNNPNNAPNNGGTDDQGNRWTQYQVQQLWRQHHAYLNGKVPPIVLQQMATSLRVAKTDFYINDLPKL